MKGLVLTVFMFLALATGVQAQKVDDPIIKACEETADKLKRTEIERDAFKSQVDIAKERDTLRVEQINNAKEQADFWKKASEKGDQIDTNSTLVIANLRQQVADHKEEIERLRRENDSLRSSRNWRTVLGFGAGFVTKSILDK